jgi:hypothetical protein
MVAHHVKTKLGWHADEWNHEIMGTAKDGSVMIAVTFLADTQKSFNVEVVRPAYTIRER